jgi:hypothetical protein
MAKSFFFQKFHPNDAKNQHFIKDIQRLVETPAVWPALLERVGDYVRASTTPGKRGVVEDLAARTNLPAIEIAYHMRCLDTLLAVFSENEEETPANLAADFVDLAGFSSSLTDQLTALFAAIQQRFQIDVALIDEEDARNGVLPVLDVVRTTTEMRGVFHRMMDGEERLENMVGIISVQLVFDTQTDSFFQCDRAGVDYLMEELRAALQRLTLLEERQSLNTPATTVAKSRTA